MNQNHPNQQYSEIHNPNRVSFRSEDLYPSEKRKASCRVFCTLPKCGKLPVVYFASFRKPESFWSRVLHPSEKRKASGRVFCTVPKTGKLQLSQLLCKSFHVVSIIIVLEPNYKIVWVRGSV